MKTSYLASFSGSFTPQTNLSRWLGHVRLCEREREYNNLPELGQKPVWSLLSKWVAAVQERREKAGQLFTIWVQTPSLSGSEDLALNLGSVYVTTLDKEPEYK